MHYLRSSVFFLACILVLGIGIANAGHVTLKKDGMVPGKPFQELQNQIDDLKAKLNAIQVNGGIHVYDANDQYLGIYTGRAPGKGVVQNSIFNPTLKLFIIIKDDPGDSDYGNVSGDCVDIDSVDNIFLWQKDRLIRLCDGRYVTGVGNPFYTHNIGFLDRDCIFNEWGPDWQAWRYNYREVLTDEIPFSLPVAMPLYYDTQAPAQ